MIKTRSFDIRFFKAMSILIGTVIGAGMFGLPYAVSRVGLIPGIIYILIIGLAVIGINLMYSEIIIRTIRPHQMSGYAKHYLGKPGQIVITLSLMLGIYGGLLAYMIGIGNFAHSILSPFLGGGVNLYVFAFWAIGSLAVFKGLGMIATLELAMVELLIFMVVFIAGVSIFKIQPANLLYTNMSNFFYPFGIILFALGGATAIPHMKKILGPRNKSLKKAAVWGLIIPIIIYIVFSIAVVGVSGINTSQQAIEGLALHFGGWIIVFGGLFGIVAMATSFLALSHVLKDLYVHDYNFPPVLAGFTVILVPLLIFLLGMQSFVQVIGISGSLLSGFQGIIIILMYYRARKEGKKPTFYDVGIPLWVGFLMFTLFLFGILYQVHYLF